MNNFERIKSMSIEELAHFINETIDICKSKEFCEACTHHSFNICDKDVCVNWLRSETY